MKNIPSVMDSGIDVIFTPTADKISKKITDGIISLAQKREIYTLIELIRAESHSYSDIDIDIFDFIARKYVWHLGYAYEYNVQRLQIGKALGAIYDSFAYKQSWSDSFLKRIYGKVPETLSTFAKIIIEDLKDCKILSENECIQLRDRYYLTTIKEYSILSAPPNYLVKNCTNLIETIFQIDEFEDYLKNKYCKYSLLSSFTEADCVKIFYNKYDRIPFELDI